MAREKLDLETIENPLIKRVLALTSNSGYNIIVSQAVIGSLPEEKIHKWAKSISAYDVTTGTSIKYVSENAIWYDLYRITWEAPAEVAAGILKNYTLASLAHFNFNPLYSVRKDVSFREYVIKRQVEDLASVGDASAEQMVDYKNFVNTLLKGYSAFDIAIMKNQNNVVSIFCEMSITKADGLQVPFISSPTILIDLNEESLTNIALYSLASSSAPKVKSKLSLSVAHNNFSAAKLFIEKGYKLMDKDKLDIIQSHKEIDFLNTIKDIDAELIAPIFAEFETLGIVIPANSIEIA